MIKNKRILVTGAGGFIGSHLCEALVNEGAVVRAFIRYTSRQDLENLEWLAPEILKSIDCVQGDLREESSVRRAMKGCDVVFHLGAIISVPYSFVSPTEFVATNVAGTANVLSSALKEGVSRVIHTSSSEVFGTGQYTPMDEKHPLTAQSPYAASKIGADKLAESYFCTYGLPVVVVRPFNTYGPRQSLRAVLPTIISQALRGNEIHIGSLTPKRDLTFVADTVRAFILAAQSPKAAGEFINVGTGKMWSVSEIIDEIGRIIGKPLKARLDQGRVRPKNSEVMRLQCDARKAQRILGWRPKYSLQTGLEQTIQWMSTHRTSERPHKYHI